MTATAPRLAGPPDGVFAAAEQAFGLGKLDVEGRLMGGPQAWDLAAGVWEFARDDPAPFLATYREAGGTVPAEEDALLHPLIGVKRILEVLRAPTDRHVDWDYQLRNLEAAERLA